MSKRQPDARAMESFMRGNANAQGQQDFEDTTTRGGGSISPDRAGYEGPEEGPFKCGNCKHFTEPSTCDLVASEVEAEGCCDLFESRGGDMDENVAPTSEPPLGVVPPPQGV